MTMPTPSSPAPAGNPGALRPMDATLGGYPWLPRLIDKSRAARAGRLGGVVHPCPVDRRCLGLLGIDVQTFGDLVAAHPSPTRPSCSARRSAGRASGPAPHRDRRARRRRSGTARA
ncbi:DUF5069 domain-containing protein [Baekduia soli]|uniref:DUF5069 domain-containing protein n=1 Tax=Baekduia soli TaxID=496014 RepID=A0A5B8U879_9ACTN|nr:DUF5069 domain-containing protein [Baekduia soli]